MLRSFGKASALFVLTGVLFLIGVARSNAQTINISQPYQFYLIPFYYSGTSVFGASSHSLVWTNNTQNSQVIDVNYWIGLAVDGTVTVNGDDIVITPNNSHHGDRDGSFDEQEVPAQHQWLVTPTVLLPSSYYVIGVYNAAAGTQYQVDNNPLVTVSANKWWSIERQF